MKRFNIRQVEAFRAVVAFGSMTKAAEWLGITQPAVSRLMTDFQEAVGFKLFQRQRGGAEPTPDARRLYQHVERLFVGLEELNQEVHAIKSLDAGSLSLAAMGPYANGLLPEIIAAFHAAHPGIGISLESLPQDRIVDWVASGRSDLGFTTLPVPNAAIPVRTLLGRPAMCVMPAGHPLGGRAEIHARDLADLPFISFPRGTPFRFEVDALFERAGVERILKVEATTHEAVCNLVGTGIGLSVVSPFSPHLRRSPELVFRPFRPAIPIELGMIGDAERLSVAAAAFHRFVLSYVDGLTAPSPARAGPARRAGARP